MAVAVGAGTKAGDSTIGKGAESKKELNSLALALGCARMV